MVRSHSLAVVLAVLLSGLTAVVDASPALAAGPRIILVTGGSLSKTVILEDWNENLTIMVAANHAVDPKVEDLAHRPSFRLAMFWGSEWDDYLKAGKDPNLLRPDQTAQHGGYYPPTGDHAAVFTFDSIPGSGALVRRLNPQGVSIFARHGVGPYPSSQGVFTTLTSYLTAHAQPLLLLSVLTVAASFWLLARRLRRRSFEQSDH